ncbi:MAG: sigma-54-dependent Fis family transcriptional regulator [Acidobacteria bacterium]|nr:MAG: sigma-54-dependent Fis family transcriptional regulator [Acidobacteriota bacterium]
MLSWDEGFSQRYGKVSATDIRSQKVESGLGKKLLFVDDERAFQSFLTRNLRVAGFDVTCVNHWAEARQVMKQSGSAPDLIIVEPLAAQADLREIFAETGPVPVVVLSAVRDPQTIVGAVRKGARDYLCKPVDLRRLERAISEVLKPGTPDDPVESVRSAPRSKNQPELIFCSTKMKQIQQVALQIANARVPVLIQGESGVGKDIIARIIHSNSRVANKPFVKVNCAALPAELTESELFGYQRGAFTGATSDRPGKFEFANGGTIFLDEIGEFRPSVQAKLLQVLQDGRFTRLGSNTEIRVNVRIIAATNRKLDEAITGGNFREDLYYRLNVVSIDVPPLRDRREEIPVLTDYFLNKYIAEYRTSAQPIPPDLMDLFMAFRWPGNVRELENVIRRYVVLQDADGIRAELENRLSKEMGGQIEALAESYIHDNPESVDLKEVSRRAVWMVERNMIVKTLRKTSWNKWRAAKELRVSYKTLLTKIEQYDIKPSPY